MENKIIIKKNGLFISIAWIFITILHGLTYGFLAGCVMAIATISIISNYLKIKNDKT